MQDQIEARYIKVERAHPRYRGKDHSGWYVGCPLFDSDIDNILSREVMGPYASEAEAFDAFRAAWEIDQNA